MTDFVDEAMTVGFTREQAEFMEAHLASYPHSHPIDEIMGLDEVLEELADEEEEEEE